MSFRASIKILSESTGTYTNGAWVAGTRSVSTIMASIQPVIVGQDMTSLPEGRSFSDYVKIYTGTPLKVTDDGNGVQPDFIVHDGSCYEFVSRYANQNKVVPHYKYIAVRQMDYTNDAYWLSGVTKRP